MPSEKEKDALRIDRSLEHEPSTWEQADAPYLRMAKALQAHAADSGVAMDPKIEQAQKEHLLQKAREMKAGRRSEIPERPKKISAQRPWWFWASGIAVAAALFLILFVSTTGTLPFKSIAPAALPNGLARLSLIIPAANAADAFDMQVEKQGVGGAELDTTFRLLSKVPVDQSTLSQSLKVIQVSGQGETEVAYDLHADGGNAYQVKPKSVLQAGEVYRLVISTAVKDDSGNLRQRDFSWAIQTKDVFRVLRSVPGDVTTGVPPNTSIEILLSQVGWADPTGSFEIQPPVSGRFETHGRTLVFLPDHALTASTLYTVTFKQGWGVSDGGPTLDRDYVFRFQTAGNETANDGYLYAASYLAESAPGTEPVIGISSDDDQTPIDVTGYSLDWDAAKQAVSAIEDQPSWIDATDLRNQAISKAAGGQVFTLSAKIQETNDWGRAISLSDSIGPGIYALRLQQGSRQPVWVILQVTDLAAYTMADRQQVMVWTVNTQTGKPEVASVDAAGQTVQTDARGLAYLKTPDVWRSAADSSADRSLVIDLSQGQSRLLTILRPQRLYYNYGQSTDDNPALHDDWSYLYADRPLYRGQDSISFFGLMQDKASGHGADQVQVKLEDSGLLDYGTYDNKVFVQADVQTDTAGFFSGRLDWQGVLSPGLYDLVLYQAGHRVLSRTIEISDVAKPAYYLQIVPAKQSFFAGDRVDGQVMAKFYDGTPVNKARISLRATGGFSQDQTVELVTDDAGFASFSFKTIPAKCDLGQAYVSCPARDNLNLYARPVLGEEGEIYASENLDVWRSPQWLGSDSETVQDGQAVMRYKVRRVDLASAAGQDEASVLKEGLPNVMVQARVFEQHWDRIQQGTAYDPIAKAVVPRYRYEMRSVAVGDQQARTESDGTVTFRFSMQEDVSYRVLTWIGEDGNQQAQTSYISRGWYDRSGDETPVLVPTSEHDQQNAYRLDDRISLSFEQGGQRLSTEKSFFLFVPASNGMRPAQFSDQPSYDFIFDKQDIPNVTIYGVAFIRHGFVVAQYDASYDSQEKRLNVTLEPGQASYAPGGQATVRAKVTDQSGVPVSDARVAISITDEALLSIAQMDSAETPLETIYRWLPDGVIASGLSHNIQARMGAGAGGAEMGGAGRNNAVRRNFKDQAAFLVVQTAADGTASGSFALPDNITSWRLTAVAVSPDERAGTTRLDLPVTKPLFVDAVIPQDVLANDQPVLKLRAFGTALPQSGQLTYTVDIPTLGIGQQSVQGDVGKAVYLSLEHPVVGEHTATISVAWNGQTQDTIQRTVRIINTHATHDERVSLELAPGTELPDTGVSPEVELIFESKARAAARQQIESLLQPWSARAESLAAAQVARDLLTRFFAASSTEPSDTSLLPYQHTSGGLGILPYASEDVALSSRLAVADPQGLDRGLLANYLWSVTDDASSTREESIEALAGLAALGQPVIDRLHSIAQLTDLNGRETMALIRGLDAIGEREVASGFLADLLSQAKAQDGLMSIQVSDDKAENIEATAEAAALAAALANPSAPELERYVATNWQDPAMTDLDRAMYLQKLVPTLVPAQATVSYAVGDQVKTMDFKEQPVQAVRLTSEEAKAFRVMSVDGPIAVSFLKSATGATPLHDPSLTVTRDYQVGGKPVHELHDGDLVTIDLNVAWQASAQDGCYALRDRLPAGLMPVVNISFDPYHEQPLFYPFDVRDGEVSFVVCKQIKPLAVSYLARVTSLGSYTAEGASLQSMVAPSVAASSPDEKIDIK